jgi:hypothetical protein
MEKAVSICGVLWEFDEIMYDSHKAIKVKFKQGSKLATFLVIERVQL